jgi:hypothetical protein
LVLLRNGHIREQDENDSCSFGSYPFEIKGTKILPFQRCYIFPTCSSTPERNTSSGYVAYIQSTELITGNYNDRMYRSLATNNSSLQSWSTSKISFFMVQNPSDHTWFQSDILDQEGKK